VFDRSRMGAADGLERGGYVLWDSSAQDDSPASGQHDSTGPAPEIVLIATGGEVAPTLQAGRDLAAQGTSVRVVSMPCMELFEAQSPDYRDSVIPRNVPARLAVEAGVSLSWWKWVGDHGAVLGIDRFGASAPGTTVLEKLGFTPDSIAAKAQTLLEKQGSTDAPR